MLNVKSLLNWSPGPTCRSPEGPLQANTGFLPVGHLKLFLIMWGLSITFCFLFLSIKSYCLRAGTVYSTLGAAFHSNRTSAPSASQQSCRGDCIVQREEMAGKDSLGVCSWVTWILQTCSRSSPAGGLDNAMLPVGRDYALYWTWVCKKLPTVVEKLGHRDASEPHHCLTRCEILRWCDPFLGSLLRTF